VLKQSLAFPLGQLRAGFGRKSLWGSADGVKWRMFGSQK
jgi:hypothetical protein